PDDATRRTRPVVPPPLPTAALRPPAMRAPVTEASPQPPARAPPQRSRTRRLLVRAVLVILGIMIFNAFANEFSVMGDANRVAGEVSTRGLDELGDLWKAQARLDARRSLAVGTAGL